jgi:ketosteroid isomerase-like protein
MSLANVELIRKAFEAYNAAGMEAVLSSYAPDVSIYTIAEWPEDPVYRGHDGALRLSPAFADQFDDFAWDVREVRDARDQVLALVTMTGLVKNSGVPIRQPIGVIFSDFHDGLIGEVRFLNTWQLADEAVGLAR